MVVALAVNEVGIISGCGRQMVSEHMQRARRGELPVEVLGLSAPTLFPVLPARPLLPLPISISNARDLSIPQTYPLNAKFLPRILVEIGSEIGGTGGSMTMRFRRPGLVNVDELRKHVMQREKEGGDGFD